VRAWSYVAPHAFLPKSIEQAVGPAQLFRVEAHDGQIVPTPVRIQRADAVRAKLATLSSNETDVDDAMAWGRGAAPAAT